MDTLSDELLALTVADEPDQLRTLLEGLDPGVAAFAATTDNGAGCLHVAAIEGRAECLEVLLEAGAPRAVVAPTGHAALHLA